MILLMPTLIHSCACTKNQESSLQIEKAVQKLILEALLPLASASCLPLPQMSRHTFQMTPKSTDNNNSMPCRATLPTTDTDTATNNYSHGVVSLRFKEARQQVDTTPRFEKDTGRDALSGALLTPSLLPTAFPSLTAF
jgi:hypothetical protein